MRIQVSQRKGVKNFHLTNITKEGASSMFQNLTDTQLLQILKTEDTSTNKNVYDIDQLIASDENIRQSTKKHDVCITIYVLFNLSLILHFFVEFNSGHHNVYPKCS